MASKRPDYAWMNGEIVPWADAKVHIRSETALRGWNVFEGIRSYASPDKQQMYVVKSTEHMDRLFNSSMKIFRIQVKWTAEEVTRGMIELLRANNFHEDVHIRPMAYLDVGEGMGGSQADQIDSGFAITALESPSKPSLWSGIKVCVSSWRRISDDVMPPRVKAGANYLNSRYITLEAKQEGYDSAIVLNREGKVSEGPGACVMIVRRGRVVTPPVTAGILESVTRYALIDLFRSEMDMEVVEREIDRTELYVADEVFFCGTGAQVQPIISVDKYPVGDGQPGPVLKEMQSIYFDIVRGSNSRYSHWLTPVYE